MSRPATLLLRSLQVRLRSARRLPMVRGTDHEGAHHGPRHDEAARGEGRADPPRGVDHRRPRRDLSAVGGVSVTGLGPVALWDGSFPARWGTAALPPRAGGR